MSVARKGIKIRKSGVPQAFLPVIWKEIFFEFECREG
jgi:hypothetical protein